MQEFTYAISYLKKDKTSGKVVYTVKAFDDKTARKIIGDKFLKDRQYLINN